MLQNIVDSHLVTHRELFRKSIHLKYTDIQSKGNLGLFVWSLIYKMGIFKKNYLLWLKDTVTWNETNNQLASSSMGA